MENVYQWVLLIGSIVGLLTALVTMIVKFVGLAKQLKGKISFSEVLRLVPKILTECEKTEQDGGIKLLMALNEIEKLCVDLGIDFDKEFWTNTISDMIDMTKNVNVQIQQIKLTKQTGKTNK